MQCFPGTGFEGAEQAFKFDPALSIRVQVERVKGQAESFRSCHAEEEHLGAGILFDGHGCDDLAWARPRRRVRMSSSFPPR